MQSTMIGVDLAKSVFQIAVSRRPGKVAESHRLSRSKFLRFFAERQPAVVLLDRSAPTSAGTRPITLTPRPCSRRTAMQRSMPFPSSRSANKR